jgi:hypothetical protein
MEIKCADLTEDMKLEEEKGAIEEKIQFTQGNC